MKRAVEDGLSLLAGAGIGMLAMYLLDPESGARRRRQLADTTRDAVSAAGARIVPAVRGAVESAEEARRSLAHAVGERASDWYQSGRKYLSEATEAAADTASEWSEDLGERARAFWQDGKRTLGFKPQRATVPAAPATAGGVGLLLLGAGLAWLLDPDNGKARRHWLRDKAMRLMRDVGDLCEKTGRHVSNRIYGTYAETRASLREDRVTDRQLAERVRAHLGHRLLADISELEVIAEEGIISLIGKLPAHEIDRAVTATREVRGVQDVLSQLLPRNA